MWSAIAATSTQLVARCIMRNTCDSESFLGSHIGSGWPKNTIGRPDSDEAANPARGIKNSATYRRTWFAWATFACHRGIGGGGGGGGGGGPPQRAQKHPATRRHPAIIGGDSGDW